MVGVYWTLDAGRRVERKTKSQKWASHQLNLAPLICRVVRAVRVRGRWAWIPGRGTPLRSIFTPNLRLYVAGLRCLLASRIW